ncbi:hypothetical protein COEREDRAFT_42369 [Coemansia reversa NRRL 1564]|uniref:Uncharacterized protein n=1 Tax=Coemansia reversa (strain ATCC 12441 / NRRL 1564) TaxID=763665 RepID=A0A2G5BCB9_COERN|nr:hypothetical protein COEREDRAFT_42369 [Coemansia reversa NRRL 1564]|eukprot:PIA16642.1 hypothetical protein COEREDRAFT_42369 [Coemansia reversa NRRL 1564]
MKEQQLRVYRHLLREVNRQFNNASNNRAWATQLRLEWIAASCDSPTTADKNMRAATNVLSYLTNNRKHKELLATFNPKMCESDRIEKTARRVGLEAPKSYSNPDMPS